MFSHCIQDMIQTPKPCGGLTWSEWKYIFAITLYEGVSNSTNPLPKTHPTSINKQVL